MKIQVKNYTFDKIAKTVTFTDFSSIDLDSILLITNVTDNIIIYNFANPLLGGTVSGKVLTLTFDTTAMDNGDKLQIFYDDGKVSALETTQSLVASVLQDLKRYFLAITRLTFDTTWQLRTTAVITSGTVTTISTVTTVTTVGTVTNTWLWGLGVNNTSILLSQIAFTNSIRNRIQ